MGTHGGVQPSSSVHGQESVAVDAPDADHPLRDGKELQDTCTDTQHSAMTDTLCRCAEELKTRVVT